MHGEEATSCVCIKGRALILNPAPVFYKNQVSYIYDHGITISFESFYIICFGINFCVDIKKQYIFMIKWHMQLVAKYYFSMFWNKELNDNRFKKSIKKYLW